MKKHAASLAMALLCALGASSGCRPRPSEIDAGAPPDVGAPVPSPVALELGLEVPLPDGGLVRRQLDASAAVVIPVTRILELTANLPLRNYRLRLLDELDRALPSDDVPEESPSGLRYHVTLLAALRPGHRYTVLLDPQSGATLDDGQGRPLPEQRLEFRTEGEREKDLPPKRTHPPKRRPR